MEKTFIGVRGVDEEAFRKFRALAVQARTTLGDALSLAMKRFVEEKKTKDGTPNPKNLLKVKGMIKTKEKVKWSEEIDSTLYG